MVPEFGRNSQEDEVFAHSWLSGGQSHEGKKKEAQEKVNSISQYKYFIFILYKSNSICNRWIILYYWTEKCPPLFFMNC